MRNCFERRLRNSASWFGLNKSTSGRGFTPTLRSNTSNTRHSQGIFLTFEKYQYSRLRRMPSSGKLRRVALITTGVSGDCCVRPLLVTAYIFLVCRYFSPWWWRWYLPPILPFLRQPHGVTFQKTTFFIVTAMKAWNLTCLYWVCCVILINVNSNYNILLRRKTLCLLRCYVNLLSFLIFLMITL
jgi:hypothetical protein